jgi:hypothetical protein
LSPFAPRKLRGFIAAFAERKATKGFPQQKLITCSSAYLQVCLSMRQEQQSHANPVRRATTICRQHGGRMRTKEVLHAGIHPRPLDALRDAGVVDRLSRGIYRLKAAKPLGNPDLITAARADGVDARNRRPNRQRTSRCSVRFLTEHNHLDLKTPSFRGVLFSTSPVEKTCWTRTERRTRCEVFHTCRMDTAYLGYLPACSIR